MKPVNPDELVAQIHLGEDQTRQDEVDGQKAFRQNRWVFLAGDVTPAGEQCQYSYQGPTDGAVVMRMSREAP